MKKAWNKKAIDITLGKYSYATDNILIAPIKYIKGLNDIDNLIHCEELNQTANFTFEKRGKVEVKGKGEMEMYFVNQK